MNVAWPLSSVGWSRPLERTDLRSRDRTIQYRVLCHSRTDGVLDLPGSVVGSTTDVRGVCIDDFIDWAHYPFFMSDPSPDGEHQPRVQFETSSEDVVTRGIVRGNHEVLADEKSREPPVGTGEDRHPTPVDYLLSSLVACQVSVLTQCLAKARVDEFHIAASADIDERVKPDLPEEMPQKSLVERIDVSVSLDVPAEYRTRAERCLEVYDQGCIVGQSIAAGIEYEPQTELTSASD